MLACDYMLLNYRCITPENLGFDGLFNLKVLLDVTLAILKMTEARGGEVWDQSRFGQETSKPLPQPWKGLLSIESSEEAK